VYEPSDVSLLDMISTGTELLVMQTGSRVISAGNTESTVDIYSLAGSTPTLVAEAPTGFVWDVFLSAFIAADDTNLFFQTSTKDTATGAHSQQIIRVRRSDGAQTVLVDLDGANIGTAQRAGDYVYFMSKQGFGSIYRVPADATGPGTQTRLTPDANADGVDDDAQCQAPYFDTTGLYCVRGLTLVRLDELAANPIVLRDAETASPYLGHVGWVDGDRLYLIFAAGHTDSWPIQRITPTDGATTDVVCDRRIVTAITGDATQIYWVEYASSTAAAAIYRARR